MKRDKVIFWVTTVIIFLFEGVLSALTSNSEQAKEGLHHLGYPEYFGIMLMVFKVLGSIVIIVPQIPNRIKEWAYAGFAIDFISAFVSMWAVDGPKPGTFFPLVFVVILILSYVSYHRLLKVSKA